MTRLSCGTLLRARCLVALLALAALPAWAQQATPPDATPAQPAPADAVDTQPAPAAEPLPPPTTDPVRRAAEDAQLPAYLRGNPFAADSASYDPWEHYNRGVFRFNKRVDTAFLKPLANAYVHGVPQPVRNGVSNFYANIRQPATTVNLVLQGHPGLACRSLGRFLVNTVIGIGGVFDPATSMHIPTYEEDFGQTLGHWGWRRSRYFLLPFLGPGTLRDRIGAIPDSRLGPIGYVHPWEWRVPVIGMEVLDVRASILPLDELGAGVDDDYVLVREAWLQRRMHQIDDLSPARDEAPQTTH